jgi:hypothetical protein
MTPDTDAAGPALDAARLIGEGFMDPADGWYWRAGGTVAPERS